MKKLFAKLFPILVVSAFVALGSFMGGYVTANSVDRGHMKEADERAATAEKRATQAEQTCEKASSRANEAEILAELSEKRAEAAEKVPSKGWEALAKKFRGVSIGWKHACEANTEDKKKNISIAAQYLMDEAEKIFQQKIKDD